jgi:hypothetical protein
VHVEVHESGVRAAAGPVERALEHLLGLERRGILGRLARVAIPECPRREVHQRVCEERRDVELVGMRAVHVTHRLGVVGVPRDEVRRRVQQKPMGDEDGEVLVNLQLSSLRHDAGQDVALAQDVKQVRGGNLGSHLQLEGGRGHHPNCIQDADTSQGRVYTVDVDEAALPILVDLAEAAATSCELTTCRLQILLFFGVERDGGPQGLRNPLDPALRSQASTPRA